MRLKSIYLGTAFVLSSISVMAYELDAFVAAQDGAATCWSRYYDARHLNAHPDQQVTGMELAVTFAGETASSSQQYVFHLMTWLRDGIIGEAHGSCMPDGQDMWCGVECDGGGIYVSTRSGGDVVVDLQRTGAIWMSSKCGEENFEDGFSLQAGIDDRQFRLTRLEPQFCMPVEQL